MAQRRALCHPAPVSDRLPDLHDWMRHGLYDPEAGYYAAGRVRFGHNADFWTFPTRLSPGFGQLLAEHLAGLRARLLRGGDLGPDDPFDVVELGAGTGALARDIVDAAAAMAGRPEPFAGLARTLRYRIGERAPALQRAQRALLGDRPVAHLPQTAADLLPQAEPMVGVILHNELLDVWPHALLRPSQGQTLRLDGGFDQAEMVSAMRRAFADPATPALHPTLHWQPTAEGAADAGYLAAIAPLVAHREQAAAGPAELLHAAELGALTSWAAKTLRAGWMLTIDYGADVSHGLDPTPALAQLRLFPQPDAPPTGAAAAAALADLDWPGRQDVTVDIDFSHLAWVGERDGLRAVLHGPQGLLAPGSSLAGALGTVELDLLAPANRRAAESTMRRDAARAGRPPPDIFDAAQLVFSAARGFVRGSAGFRMLLQEREGTAGTLAPVLAGALDAFPVLPADVPLLWPDATPEAIAAALHGALGEASAPLVASLTPSRSLVCAVDEAGLRAALPAILRALEPLRLA